jgi:flagellar basal body rod protein FlgG
MRMAWLKFLSIKPKTYAMILGIGASLTALTVFGKKLANSAGNIANSNTDGYKKSIAGIREDRNGLPEILVERSESPGAFIEEAGVMRETSNVDLVEEFPQIMIALRGYQANTKALKAQDEILQSTLDMDV